MHRSFIFALVVPTLALGAAIVGGCPGTLDDPNKFKSGDGGVQCFDVEAEFHKTCVGAGCHNAKEMTQMLNLESPDIAGRLTGTAATECVGSLINPANAANSIIYKKLTSSPPCGLQMPLTPPGMAPIPLYNEQQLQCILTWIESLEGGGTGGSGTGGSGGSGGGTGGSATGGSGGTGGV